MEIRDRAEQLCKAIDASLYAAMAEELECDDLLNCLVICTAQLLCWMARHRGAFPDEIDALLTTYSAGLRTHTLDLIQCSDACERDRP
jgi:hypothetical protein